MFDYPQQRQVISQQQNARVPKFDHVLVLKNCIFSPVKKIW